MSADPVAVIVSARDRFSTVPTCIAKIFENTPEPFKLIVVLGGAPPRLRKELEARYGGKADLVFEPRYLNTAQSRNIGLRRAGTRLAACLDTDVFVRPGWLGPLVRCQAETGAALVVPLILDRDERVHTAGNDLFISEENGRKFCKMELRYAHMAVGGTTNLARREVDFGEVHCQLVVVETALRLGVYDERYREGHDIDSGLTWAKAGEKMFFEPGSRVYLHYPDRLDDPEDIKIYVWKWDLPAIRASFDYFREKWGMDRTGRDGSSLKYYVSVYKRVGPLARRFPTRAVIAVENAAYRATRKLRKRLTTWVHSGDEALWG
jgi:hypothetical protein